MAAPGFASSKAIARFRLLQTRRIMDINAATALTLEIVEAARDRLVI